MKFVTDDRLPLQTMSSMYSTVDVSHIEMLELCTMRLLGRDVEEHTSHGVCSSTVCQLVDNPFAEGAAGLLVISRLQSIIDHSE
jgi:hypothetical protein